MENAPEGGDSLLSEKFKECLIQYMIAKGMGQTTEMGFLFIKDCRLAAIFTSPLIDNGLGQYVNRPRASWNRPLATYLYIL